MGQCLFDDRMMVFDPLQFPSACPVQIAGETMVLLPERAVFWPKRSTLLVADLHWGKTETFRAAGIAIPQGVLQSDLHRLGQLLEMTRAKRLIVLGDLFHSPKGLTDGLVETLQQWRNAYPAEFILIQGNHDRPLSGGAFQEKLGCLEIQWIDSQMAEGPFVFAHEPEAQTGAFVWCGHVHPVVKLNMGLDTFRLPCFHIGSEVGVLPAFSEFTGGYGLRIRETDRIFAILTDEVMEVTAMVQPAIPSPFKLKRSRKN